MERRYDWVVKFKELESKYYRLAQNVKPKPDEPIGNELYIENVGDEAGAFSVKRNGNPVYTPNLEVKIDNGNWIAYNIVEGGTVEVTVPKGSKIYLRGNNPEGFNGGNGNDDNYSFTFSQPYNTGGYINSLLVTEGFETYELSDTGISHTFCRLFAFEWNLKDAKDMILSLEYLTPSCYSGLFGWSGITSLPKLPSTHLESSCYHNLCYECRDLQDASIVLPAEDVRFNSYDYMFGNCPNLVNAPIIMAKKIDLYGCMGMFAYCTSLVEFPDLQATEVMDFACQAMFRGCTSLQTAPTLPATTALDGCYMEMFEDCTALVEAPELPATTLYQQCYRKMFKGCTALEVAPVLVAPVLEGYMCYAEMFQGCSNLRSVTLLCDDIVTETNLTCWLEGVAATGTLTKKAGVEIPSGRSGIPEGWEVVELADPFYIENVDTVPGYFTLSKNGTPTYTPNLNYKIDNGEWFEYDVVNRPRIEVPVGSKIYLKGNNTDGFNQAGTSTAYYNFNFYSSSTTVSSYCKSNIGGYITSLLVLDNFNLISEIPNYSFYSLFSFNQGLLSAENLITSNITTVGENSLYQCFNGCTALVTAPTFENVTSVGDYSFHLCFINCTALVTAPTFENVTSVGIQTFRDCFNGCTALVTAPTFENVTSVGLYGFYNCFNGCTALVTAPTFENVTSVGDNSYMEMFKDCTALVTAPKFNKVTIVGTHCFSGCFIGCTSLVTAPTFENVTSVGRYGFYNCFNGCTSLVTAPTFENVTKVYDGYSFKMCFIGCTSLVTAPTFDKIKTVGDGSFQTCFQGCTSLETIYAPRPSTWDTSKFTDWVDGVPKTGTFYKKAGVEIPSGSSGIPTGWTVVEV